MADSIAEEGKGIGLYPLFLLPEGSLAEFPPNLEKVFAEEDVRLLSNNEWYSKRSAACVLSLYPELLPHTYGLSLEEQQLWAEGSLEPLTPYDIACVAALTKKSGMARPFRGRVRTAARAEGPLSHLHTIPLTVIASFDEAGVLRFFTGYTSQTGGDLGFLVGERRVL